MKPTLTPVCALAATLVTIGSLVGGANGATIVPTETIDFNGLGTNTSDPVVVMGFEFTYLNQNGWAIGSASNLLNDVGNGTEFITARDTNDADSSIVMSLLGGGSFQLQSFDGADALSNIGGRSIEVIGNLEGGGAVVQTFTTTANVFTTFGLPPRFSGLTSVEFHNFGPTGDGFALDNITVLVPEPSAALLLGLAAFGLTAKRRRTATASPVSSTCA